MHGFPNLTLGSIMIRSSSKLLAVGICRPCHYCIASIPCGTVSRPIRPVRTFWRTHCVPSWHIGSFELPGSKATRGIRLDILTQAADSIEFATILKRRVATLAYVLFSTRPYCINAQTTYLRTCRRDGLRAAAKPLAHGGTQACSSTLGAGVASGPA